MGYGCTLQDPDHGTIVRVDGRTVEMNNIIESVPGPTLASGMNKYEVVVGLPEIVAP